MNLDLAGGVVFNKGCYPGQEVVSRMHHLGETPRRGLILASEEALQLEPGAPIFSGEDEAGAALALARTGRGTLLFASVKRSLAAGTLRAGSAGDAGHGMRLLKARRPPFRLYPEKRIAFLPFAAFPGRRRA